jgi:hypothetical protein
MQLSHLLSLSYWLDASVLDQRAGPAMWLVVAAGLAWAAGGLALRRAGRLSRGAAIAQIAAGGMAAAVAIGRLYAIPVLGLRAGWLIAGAVGATPALAAALRMALRDGVPGDALRALAFATGSGRPGWHPVTQLLWLALHLAGLAAVASAARLPLALAPILVVVILAPALLARAARRPNLQSPISNLSNLSDLGLPALTPLLFVYAALALRILVAFAALATTGAYRVVEPFGSLLNLPLALVVLSAYGFAVSLSLVLPRATFVRAGAAMLIAGTAAWAVWTAAVLRTHGVSGSDPYAYTQMGVDLARHGTVYHAFPLARITHDLGIATDPVVHIGYRLPEGPSALATTVWPPGYAVFTGLAFALAGETGLYWVTPVLSLLSLAAVGWLASSVARGAHAAMDRPSAIAAAALAVFLTATSYQQVEWQMTPMADVAAQLLSILALALALTPARGRRAAALFPALSGVCLGLAFSVRYTQVLIAPALALALWLPPAAGERKERRARAAAVLVCALAALAAAAPVMIYHTLAFGSPLRTGSEEWANFSLARLPDTLTRIVSELASPREFGLLLPLIAAGLFFLSRHNRRGLGVLLLYAGPLFLFHVVYWPLRLRDILSLFPILSILAALGAAWSVGRGACSVQRAAYRVLLRVAPRPTPHAPRSTLHALRAALLLVLTFAFVLRAMDTLVLPVTRGFGAFGHLVREQRASFARLAELTPPNAVVGASLNSGAIDLHAGRQAFRPAGWRADELLAFARAAQAEARPVYIFEDGAEVGPAVEILRQHYTVEEVARLDAPYYFPGSGSENRKIALWLVAGR